MKKTIVDFTALMITAAALGTALRTAQNGQWGMFMLAALVGVASSAVLVLRGVEHGLTKPVKE